MKNQTLFMGSLFSLLGLMGLFWLIATLWPEKQTKYEWRIFATSPVDYRISCFKASYHTSGGFLWTHTIQPFSECSIGECLNQVGAIPYDHIIRDCPLITATEGECIDPNAINAPIVEMIWDGQQEHPTVMAISCGDSELPPCDKVNSYQQIAPDGTVYE